MPPEIDRTPGSQAAKTPDIDVREKLLAGALELFTTKGYASTTVREIVETAGVSKPVLYYYFRNKEGIYLELMGKPFEEFSGLLEHVLAEGEGAGERIVRLSLRVFDLVRRNISAARLMYAIYYGPPQGAPFFDFDAVHTKVQKTFLRLVEEGIAAGEIGGGRPEDIMWALIGVLNVAIEVELCHPERGLGSEGVERVLRLILGGLSG